MVTLDEIENINKDISFHFTDKQVVESILKDGLTIRIGDNSSGSLGTASVNKVCISYGARGVIKLANHILNLGNKMDIGELRTKSHEPFLPDHLKAFDSTYRMNELESFEFLRQYLDNKNYFAINTKMIKYENELTAADLEEINDIVDNLTDDKGMKLIDKKRLLDNDIEGLTNEIKGKEDEFSEVFLNQIKEHIKIYTNQRREVVQNLYKLSVDAVKAKQGKVIDYGDEILENIDFDDEHLKWENYENYDHNTHTVFKINNGVVEGTNIGVDKINLVSQDGKEPMKGSMFIKEIYEKYGLTEGCNLSFDVDLIPMFVEYCNLIEQYKEQGLLVKREEKMFLDNKLEDAMVVDFNNLEKYEGLNEFCTRLKEYYNKQKEIIRANRRENKEQSNSEKDNKEMTTSTMAKSFAKDTKVAEMSEVAKSAFNYINKERNLEEKINNDVEVK